MLFADCACFIIAYQRETSPQLRPNIASVGLDFFQLQQAVPAVTTSALSNTAAAKLILNNTSRVSPWISWRWCYWPTCQKAERQMCSAE